MTRPTQRTSSLLVVLALSTVGCAARLDRDGADLFSSHGNSLTRSQRRVRAEQIRDEAASHGVTNGWALASLADAETGLAHCWSEATWACRGPASRECGGGPMIAGSADGPCSRREGGLGLFQFDAGDHDATLRRDGERIRSVEGSTQAAVEFVVAVLIRSRFVDVDDREQALAFLNRLRPDGADYHGWIQTVTGYYNGCFPEVCGVYEARYARYDERHRALLAEMGEGFFWSHDLSPSEPPPSDPVDPVDPVEPTDPAEPPSAFCDGGYALGETGCAMGDEAYEYVCRNPDLAGEAQWERRACGVGEECVDFACAPVATACSVEGHGTRGDGGDACAQPEAWRCAFSDRFGTWSSQVCRDGRWLIFHLDPVACDGCCGSYSADCV